MRSFAFKHIYSVLAVCMSIFLLAAVSCTSSGGKQGGEGPLDTAALRQAGEARDSLAADEALKTWWPGSMRDHDKRIAWWREARFGCFIHWGVYSGPGGEWKGEPVHGYAEHLMRIKKIPLAEYKKEVVATFNPEKFNADEWVKKIKAAGMRYLIITSKHHDGFAMYDSDVKDYNIVKETPFHRDPMKELSEACKKQGIRFGFYYSHAFDWEDPNAPGNDWDYDNPGGDKHLFGGEHWYDLHPDMLARIKKYVNEKSIPQIKELIAKYHPDILWFDTPHKLPFSENLRILQEIRKVDTTVVINGRLARYGSMNFGDYKSTADRPLEFYPVEGDWEAIPTTNESYGYSKFDSSHKPFSHFIHLLAKAASRGGNMLMNIGPMGNGKIDPRDTVILYGIGQWMRKNAESIYGTVATPLPLQPWGVSTFKDNKLYLQVFQWPKDGKLIVGGLKSDISGAYFLNDPDKKSLQFKRLNENDLALQVPPLAPDTINTVIVVNLKSPVLTDSIRLISTVIPNRLLAFDSDLHGKGLRYGDGKSARYYVYGWDKKDQWMSWDFRLNAPGTFKVSIKYETDEADKGSDYVISIANQQIKKAVQFPGKRRKTYIEEIGTVKIPAGVQTMSIKPGKIAGNEVMKLFEIILTPVQ